MNGISPFCTEYRRLNAAGDYLPHRKAGLPPSGCAKNFRGFFRVMLLPNCWQERFLLRDKEKIIGGMAVRRRVFLCKRKKWAETGCILYPFS